MRTQHRVGPEEAMHSGTGAGHVLGVVTASLRCLCERLGGASRWRQGLLRLALLLADARGRRTLAGFGQEDMWHLDSLSEVLGG